MGNIYIDQISIQGFPIPSAATVDLENATGNLVDITGTTTITRIVLFGGHVRTVRFTGALTLTHSSTLVLPGATNIVTGAGDFAVFAGYSDGVIRCISYQQAAGGTIGDVDSVFGRTGVVSAVAGDYTADEVTFVPAGDIAATDVQAAIEELDTEKAAVAEPIAAAHIADATAAHAASAIVNTPAGTIAATDVQTAINELDTEKTGGNTTNNLGYLNIPQNSQSDNYVCVLTDSGKHLRKRISAIRDKI